MRTQRLAQSRATSPLTPSTPEIRLMGNARPAKRCHHPHCAWQPVRGTKSIAVQEINQGSIKVNSSQAFLSSKLTPAASQIPNVYMQGAVCVGGKSIIDETGIPGTNTCHPGDESIDERHARRRRCRNQESRPLADKTSPCPWVARHHWTGAWRRCECQISSELEISWEVAYIQNIFSVMLQTS